jgi:hypothetical protein
LRGKIAAQLVWPILARHVTGPRGSRTVLTGAHNGRQARWLRRGKRREHYWHLAASQQGIEAEATGWQRKEAAQQSDLFILGLAISLPHVLHLAHGLLLLVHPTHIVVGRQ